MSLPTNVIDRDDGNGVTTFIYGKAIASAEEAVNLGPYKAIVDGTVINVPYHLFRQRWRHRKNTVQIIRTPKQIVDGRFMFPLGDIGVPPYEVTWLPYAGPTSFSSIVPGMGMTGERPDLGLITDVSAHFMRTGNPTGLLAWADAASSFPMYYMDEATGRPISLQTYPKANNYWLEGRQGEPWMRVVDFSPYAPGIEMTTNHWPEMSYMAYVATGDLGYLEDLQYAANYAVFCDAYYSSAENGAVLGIGETRFIAWGLRNLAMARRATKDAEDRGVLPDHCHPSSYWLALLTQSRVLLEDKYMKAADRQLSHSISGTDIYPGTDSQAYGPWQMDYLLCVFAFCVLVGLDDFKQLYTWAFGNAVWRSNGTSGWPVAWCPYYLPSGTFKTNGELWAWFSNTSEVSAERRDALNADQYNGGHMADGSMGNYCNSTRAVLCMGVYLQDIGAIDLKATYPELETCYANFDRMVRNNGTVSPRTSYVRDPSKAPGEIVPLPDPKPIPQPPQPQEPPMAKTLDDVQNEVHQTTGVIASAIALINGLRQKLADAISGQDTAANQAKVQAIIDELDKGQNDLAAAVAANTPVAN